MLLVLHRLHKEPYGLRGAFGAVPCDSQDHSYYGVVRQSQSHSWPLRCSFMHPSFISIPVVQIAKILMLCAPLCAFLCVLYAWGRHVIKAAYMCSVCASIPTWTTHVAHIHKRFIWFSHVKHKCCVDGICLHHPWLCVPGQRSLRAMRLISMLCPHIS